MIFSNEFLKTALKWRTYIGFIAVAILVPLVEYGFKLDQGSVIRNVTRGLSQDFLFFGNLFNGYFVTNFIMNSLWLHIPFLITLVAGDMLAGEATAGTLRLLLTRPASRTRLFLAKFGVTLLFTALLVLFLALLSLVLGLWLFGSGDLLVLGRDLVILPESDVPLRLALTFALAVWSMWCVASLAFFFSSIVENAIGPIVGSMAVIIICLLISTIDLGLFEKIRPFLFTTYFNFWRLAVADPIPWDEIAQSAIVLGAYSAGFAGITWVLFVRKDVMS